MALNFCRKTLVKHLLNGQSNSRQLHLTHPLAGKPIGEHPIKNTEDFKWPNQIGTFEHYKLPQSLLDYEYNYPVCRDTMGIRWPGYWFKRKFVYVQEMEPELVVPDLTDFPLKPYVSYRTKEINIKPFTAKELFEKVYAEEIEKEFEDKKIDHEETYSVSQEQIDSARLKAAQTGSDLFEEYTLDGVRAPMVWSKEL